MTFIGIIMAIVGIVLAIVGDEHERWDALVFAFLGIIIVLITL